VPAYRIPVAAATAQVEPRGAAAPHSPEEAITSLLAVSAFDRQRPAAECSPVVAHQAHSASSAVRHNPLQWPDRNQPGRRRQTWRWVRLAVPATAVLIALRFKGMTIPLPP